jgi:hypothetical protein
MTVIQAIQGATLLDLDVMARIAEEAGRDASRKSADEATFETNAVLRTIPNFQTTLVIATRLYQACLAGATDPAAD